ncbi:hypothetical protein [uncultured Arcticibacterium sp.]|uniref:hypothetical protein n=1 Tax=uncultured Arcticibacterium sp. TaxID=2173042 RepID=UPI0030F4FF12
MTKSITTLCIGLLLLFSLSCKKDNLGVSFEACSESPVSIRVNEAKFCSDTSFLEFQNVDFSKKEIDIFLWYRTALNGSDNSYYMHLTSNYSKEKSENISYLRIGDGDTYKESEKENFGKLLITNDSNNQLTGSFSFEIKDPNNLDETLKIEGLINNLRDL